MAYRDDPALGDYAGGTWSAASLSRATARSSERRSVVDFRPGWLGACPEVDCLRAHLLGRAIAMAERRAAELGIGADRVLIAQGWIGEDRYLARLAAWLGIEHAPSLDEVPREACPLGDIRLIEAAELGLLPLILGGELTWLVAPRHLAARTLTQLMSRSPRLARRLRLTSTGALNRFIARHGSEALAAQATDALRTRWPQLSAAPRRWRPPVALAAMAIAFLGLLYAFPGETRTTVEASLAFGFLAWLLLRLIGSFLTPPLVRPLRIPDSRLPVYTIIIALYREASAVEGLLTALRELDYPPEKLDIKFATEADDLETGIALARLDLGVPFEIVTAPTSGPRTKPKALNAALAFARGTFTAVYDAEDRPEPNQLKRALDVFLSAGDDLSCVQASLTIDNTADNWLTRLFTAEYAAQFDLFLPGLAALELPLPLGGSSNHFRTAALRKAGAWDPYNVTEDADLGVRLARFGYRSTILRSTTYEEAPARFGPWLRQRTRWFKGWLKTWLVHMRSPVRLFADLGFAGFVSFQLVVGGSVLAALIHPLVLAGFVYAYVAGLPLLGTDGKLVTALAWLYGIALGAGYFTSIFVGIRGLKRRGLLRVAWWLALVPLHWLLLSLAAWRALLQLLRDPQRWEKTEHGLARTSRRAGLTSRAAPGAVFTDDDRNREFHREAAE
jgi:cellulose synthase/poly-beta-1,6-N-acetylglucosamine synthase-like glycosyltransferase